MVEVTLSLLALLTGATLGGVFAYLQIPAPAPPELPGVLGIVGIYLGYRLVAATDWGYDLLGALGL